MTPSRGSKSLPKETLALPSPFAPISPYCPPAYQRNELLFHSPGDITASPTFPWRWQAGEAEAKDEGQAQGGARLYEGGGSCSLPIRPGGHGTKRPLPSSSQAAASTLQPFPSWSPGAPPFLILALVLPQSPPLPISLLPSGLSSSAHPCRGPGRGTSVSLSSAALFLFVFILKRPTHCIKNKRVYRDLGFWDSRTREGSGLPQAAQQGPGHLSSLSAPCVPSHPYCLPARPPLPPAPSHPPARPQSPLRAGKIMNKPGKHEINIRRKNMAAIK